MGSMNYAGKTVLVTGSAGFIGSHLTEKLVEQGANVRAFVRYNSKGTRGWLDESPVAGELDFIAGDVSDQSIVMEAVRGCDVVFHLAALIGIPYSYESPSAYVRTNIQGTLNILEAARHLGVEAVVQTSTSEVYGTALQVPISESHPLQGQSPYSASKIGADKLAESYFLSFGVPVVTVRPFNTYGPRQSSRAIIPTIITQCLMLSSLKLGNLTPTRDLNYVGNTVDGFLLAGNTPEAVGQTINLGSGEEISIGQLAEEIVSLTGNQIAIEQDEQRLRPEKSEVNRLLADASRAREILGWKPAISFRQGLELTIDWFREHLAEYRPEEYHV